MAAFVEYCYDANRLDGRSKRPEAGSGWALVPDSARAALNIEDDPAIEAWLFAEPDGAGFLLLQIHERVLEDAGPVLFGETRHSCQITWSGSENPDAIYDQLIRLFDGIEGYDDPQGLHHCGYSKPRGWKQWAWSAMPKRASRDWRIRTTTKRGSAVCITVTAKRQYHYTGLFVVRLLAKQEEPHLAVLALDYTFRPPESEDEEKAR